MTARLSFRSEPGGMGSSPAVRGLSALLVALEALSAGAAWLARIGTAVGAALATGAVAANVFTRYVLGYSIIGTNELASYAFLWTIWLGISLAVRRGAVTQLTLLTTRGPGWWRRSVRTFAALSLGALLGYACLRSYQYARSPESLQTFSAELNVRSVYPIVSMPVGFAFITLHYTRAVVAGAVQVAARGRRALGDVVSGAVGGLALTGLVWGLAAGLLTAGAPKLLSLGIIFVALTLAGTPIVFMLAIVGIVATVGLPGLSVYPNPDQLFPFRTTQNTMGLSGFTELIVILMFLIVAETMNASGMSDRLIRFAATIVGHLRGGMAYVCQLVSALASGVSGSAQADAAIMTPLLVPAMEKEGYPRDVAASVVAGASIKGPIGPISIMFIAYGVVVQGAAGASIRKLLVSGILAEVLLLILQGATVYFVVRRLGFFEKRPFAGIRTVGREGVRALPVLAVPVVIIGGILSGVFTPSESGGAAVVVALALALFWYGTIGPGDIPPILVRAGIETGIVMLLVGTSQILATTLQNNGFGDSLNSFFTGFTSNKYVFLLVANLLLLAVGLFIEPLPALYILAPVLAPVAVLQFGVDPVQFGLIMVFNLVLALIHPPIGLVLFLVSSISKVSIERLSITILPWLAVSLVVLFLITYLPSQIVLVVANLLS